MISDRIKQFEVECRALYERHQVVGFFTYMNEDDAKVRGQLRAYRHDRRGILLGTQNVANQLLSNIACSERSTAAADA